jgi:hypothetical protein
VSLPPENTARRDDRHGSRLGDVIRRLSSNSDGEIIATVRAIRRILDSCSVDIHALADHVEKVNGGSLTEAHDMTARTVWREPTEKQGKWLKSIYYRLGGKRQ